MLDWATESEARLRGRRMAILTVQRLTIFNGFIFFRFSPPKKNWYGHKGDSMLNSKQKQRLEKENHALKVPLNFFVVALCICLDSRFFSHQ